MEHGMETVYRANALLGAYLVGFSTTRRLLSCRNPTRHVETLLGWLAERVWWLILPLSGSRYR